MSDYFNPDRIYYCSDVKQVFEFDCCYSCHEDHEVYDMDLCNSTKKLSNGDWIEIRTCCEASFLWETE